MTISREKPRKVERISTLGLTFLIIEMKNHFGGGVIVSPSPRKLMTFL
jgi:hypothetical protein